MSESKFKASKEHYEKVIKEKNDRIRELEVENEVLKKRHLSRISNNLHLHRQNST